MDEHGLPRTSFTLKFKETFIVHSSGEFRVPAGEYRRRTSGKMAFHSFFMASSLLRGHDGNMIRQATREDFPAILNLQFLAFGEVAERLGLTSLPPLEQTLEHLQEEARHSIFFKYTENGRIVGSVRGRLDATNVCRIGKLIVDPACRNRGIGQKLMLALEEHFRKQAAGYLLFTSADTPETLYLYRKLGYTELYRKDANGTAMVFLEKKA